eukprot:CAMPEP_0174835394 /NCGR_PEP_ID=MMETSP1114-20130205/5383_1 /TAXON_ID=312471 /ORGANISM="Neobodo designis, Strain CCAP 1951/1" /LENGTH=784 /DNA_ID=CAMNT_0016069341 /DNA_START=142 /DNA_END=2496 /DNA_ORIENTATION=-
MLRRARPRPQHDDAAQVSAGADVDPGAPVRPWTSAERGLLADLAAQECRLSDIAAGLGRSVDDCRRQLAQCRPAAQSPAAPQQQQQQQQPPSSCSSSTPQAASANTAASGNASAPWRLQDDLDLVEYVATHGPQWTLIAARHMPQRSPRSLMRRWALIESLMLNAAAAAHVDGGQSAQPSGPAQLRNVLQQHHIAAANRRRGVQSGGPGASAHQRVAAALIGGTFRSPAAGTSVSSSTATNGPAGSAAMSSGATSFGSVHSGSAPTPLPRSPQLVGVKRTFRPSPAPSSGGISPTPRSARSSTTVAAAAGPLSGFPATEPATSLSAAGASPAPSDDAFANTAKKQHRAEAPRDVTGDDIVAMVSDFVERHALDTAAAASGVATATSSSSDAPRVSSSSSVERTPTTTTSTSRLSARRTGAAIDVAEQQHRAAAAASVAQVMDHLELHRPHEQTQRVALEVSHRHMAATATHGASASTAAASELVSASLVPASALGMECGGHHADATPVDGEPMTMRGARGSLRAPETEEVQAVVAMHIHRSFDAPNGSAPASAHFPPAQAPPRPLTHQEPPPAPSTKARGSAAWLFNTPPPAGVAGLPVAGYDDDAELRAAATTPGASALATASGAAFLASWANLELSGAFTSGGGTAWSNVFEPQRCMLRSAVPRALAFLPCAYLSCTGGAAASSAAAASPTPTPPPHPGSSAAAFGDAARSYTIAAPRPATSLTGAHAEGRASLLCPVHVSNRVGAFVADMRAALNDVAAVAVGRSPQHASGSSTPPAAAFL